MDGGDGNRRDPGSATRPIVSIAAIVFGGLGIAFQQLSTGQPQSVGRWLMLAVGSLIGGAVGILATGLFDRLLAWATTGWERFRERAQARTVLLAVLVQPRLPWGERVRVRRRTGCRPDRARDRLAHRRAA